jgi:hypothetical protein
MNKIGMFGLVIAVAIAGAATMSVFVVSADAARPNLYCAKDTGKPDPFPLSPCFPTKENCEAYADSVAGRQVCIPRSSSPT